MKESQEESTVVVFRWWKDEAAGVIAIFPEIPSGNSEYDGCLSYGHIGQHGGCDPLLMIYKLTRPATAKEYGELKKELETIGYNLKVRKKITQKHLLARRANLGFFNHTNYPHMSEVTRKGIMKETFKECVKKWKLDTGHLSRSDDILTHPSYQAIIRLGPDVLPLIFENIDKVGGHWYHALRVLTGENPVTKKNNGNIMEMNREWLEWADIKGIYKRVNNG